MSCTTANLMTIAIAGSLLAACASGTTRNDGPPEAFVDDPRLGAEVKQICFASNIDGFQNPERKTVVVSEGSDDYLIEVFGSCFNLNNAQGLAVQASGSCLRRGDYIIAADSAFGIGTNDGLATQRCSINRMYEWDAKATVTEEADENGSES